MPPPNYKKFTRKTLKRIGSTAARGGGWGNFSKKLRETAKIKETAAKSSLKPSAPIWTPPNHTLRLRRKSNASFTRNENKKMTNELFKTLHKEHVKRQS